MYGILDAKMGGAGGVPPRSCSYIFCMMRTPQCALQYEFVQFFAPACIAVRVCTIFFCFHDSIIVNVLCVHFFAWCALSSARYSRCSYVFKHDVHSPVCIVVRVWTIFFCFHDSIIVSALCVVVRTFFCVMRTFQRPLRYEFVAMHTPPRALQYDTRKTKVTIVILYTHDTISMIIICTS